MAAPVPRLGIVFEHSDWFLPLFAELNRREVPYDRVEVSAHSFDPTNHEVPWSMVLNRMSPSAYLRGHGQAISYTREFLRYLEATGVDVINGARAFELETSKVSQLLLLRRLHLPAPRARVINNTAHAPRAADSLTFPVIVKPNIGGSGASMQHFETPDALHASVEAGSLEVGIDQVALVQEFLPARDGHIVRVEVLDGRFLYAIKVYPNPAAGFNLCPADICQPTAMPQGAPSGSATSRPSLDANFCPAELPKLALRVEAYTPPAEVVQAVLAIAAAAGLDLCGVEYLVNERDGRPYYYDINALSNFVTDAVHVVGFDPHTRLVDYLVARGRLRAKARVPA